MRRMHLALLSWFAMSVAAAAEGDCALKKVASIPLDMSGEVPTLIARVDDSDLRFVVDTGSTYSAIDQKVAQDLGLKSFAITRGEIYGGGEQLDRYVRPKAYRIDIAEIAHPTLLLLPRGYLPAGADGVVGADFLSHFDADFDFGQKTLNLFSPKHCKGQVVYWTTGYTTVPMTLTDSRKPYIDVTLGGRSVSAVIITGSKRVYISEVSMSRIFGIDAKSPGAEPLRDETDPDRWRYAYRFDELSFEGVAVRNPRVEVYDDANARAFSRHHNDRGQFDVRTAVRLDTADLKVGMRVLSSLHMYIAYDEQMLYISAAGAR